MEEEFDEFSDIIIVAMQAWRGFEKKSAQLVKAFNDFSASHKYDAGADIAKGGKAMHPGTDIGI